ncbi:hypothetical protein L7F22_005713 [Adiantum nelumboides]|nr:hypothetical protein [Adiantum nelumboides]
MAQRVASELSLPSTRVSHQIRYDATVSPSTSVKFMTDGVLLRELAANFLLEKYSAIIIDEAHERSVNTDVLIGVLSRVVKLRAKRWIEGESGAKPLRLIIMSATLRVDDFVRNSTLFDTPPPVINVEARQHSVTVHFNRRTTHDYIAEAVKKVTKIHARLPPGGVLVFMTGQQEITTVCRRLEKRFGRKAIEQRRRDRERIALAGAPAMRQHDDEEGESLRSDDRVALAAKDGDVEAEEIDLGVADQELAADVDGEEKDLSDADDDALDSDDEEGGEAHDADMPDELKDDSDVPMHILPLYSLLSSDRQMRVFQPPPAGTRLVVVATNVAETSLTIPGISYVVDCGRSKERRCDPSTGVQSFEVSWISKASANQRSGRAGRTGPGHCYRLYSSAVYEDHFDSFSQPEILRTPVDGLVLQMKAMNIDQVAHFPFPTPPDRAALQKAERMLIRLGALEMQGLMSGKGSQSRITQLGRAMSLFPLGPRLSKLLVQGNQHGCLPFIVALVAALTVGDPFVQEQSLVEHDGEDEEEDEDGAKISAMDEDLPPELEHIKSEKVRRAEAGKSRRSAYFKALARFGSMSEGASDPLRLLSVVGAYEHDGATQAFCHAHFLMPKAMEEIHKLRGQVASIVMANAGPEEAPKLAAQLGNPKFAAPPTTKQLTVLRQLLCAAYVDQVAIRADLAPESASRVHRCRMLRIRWRGSLTVRCDREPR